MTKPNKIIVILLFLILILTALTAGLSTQIVPPVGAVVLTENNFDTTRVEDDLADVNMQLYPRIENGTPRIVELIEYCYTENVFRQSNYGLYLYVYNPAQTVYSEQAGANVVNMAIEYGLENKPGSWENVSLTYCGKTTESGYENLFYKFRITNAEKIMKNAIYSSKTFNERRYDIEGMQLRNMDGVAKDYGVGGTWHYTGFAKGYGTEEKSTLECKQTDHETVRLNVEGTVYRPEGMVTGEYIKQTQLASVYFAVPDKLYNDYGRLQKIKATWDQYDTGLVGVFDDQTAFNAFDPLVGKKVTPQMTDRSLVGAYEQFARMGVNPTNGTPVWNYFVNQSKFAYNTGTSKFGKIWNGDDYIGRNAWTTWGDEYDTLAGAFKVNKAADTHITSAQVTSELLRRSAGYDGEKINGKYDPNLFVDAPADFEHKKLCEIDADEEFSLTTTVINKNFWLGWLGLNNTTTTTYDGIKAIERVNAVDLIGSDEEIAKRLYVDVDDVGALKEYYAKNSAGNHIELFRFSQGDYMSSDVYSNVKDFNTFEKCGYASQETVYLDFDIISLTFNRDGVYTVIPVVSDPIDVIGGISPPPTVDGCNKLPRWLIIVIVVVCGIILLPVIVALLPSIIKLVAFLVKWAFKLVWWIVSAPFRFIAWIAQKVGERPEKAEKVRDPKPAKVTKNAYPKNRGQEAVPQAKAKTRNNYVRKK